MSNALCFKCGTGKSDFVSKCARCGAKPKTRDELNLSLVYSSHLADVTTLSSYARSFAEGRRAEFSSVMIDKARLLLEDMLADPQVGDIVRGLIKEAERSPAVDSIPPETALPKRTVRTKNRKSNETSLHRNPFYTIGATTRDERKRIVELAEEKSLHGDHELCQQARSVLINPRTRLAAEMSWLPGLSPKKAEHLMQVLTDDPMAIRGESGIPALAHANLVAAVFDTLDDEDSPELVASFIVEFAWLADTLKAEAVLRDINEDRSVSGFPGIVGIETIEAEIAQRKMQYRDSIKAALGNLSTTDLAAAMTAAVVAASDNGESYGPALIHELVDTYEVGAQGFLKKEAANVAQLIVAITAAAPKGTAAVDPLIAKVGAVTANWKMVARPIQLSTKARGIEHQSSAQVAYSIRGLAAELFREHDMLAQAQTLTNIIGESFSEVPEVSELVAGDVASIDDLFKQRKETAEQEAEWAKAISYSADIGAVFKSRFEISRGGIQWKGRKFPLETVKYVRWGGMSHSVNGIPTGTTYSITFGDGSSHETISLKRGEVYSNIINALWRAVGIRLMTEMLAALGNSKRIQFGGAVISDDGVELTRHRSFRSDERVPCGWADVLVQTANGSFLIKSKSDSKTYDALSYINLNNIHVLEAAIRMFFKSSHPKMSDLLKGN